MTRTATVTRSTRETTVTVSVDLDGSGETNIATGVGMFDHLLTSFGHHSMIDVDIAMEGDLEVDDHHTIEDTMLSLGEALDMALGDRAGIVRYGDARIPMDEAIAQCAIDLGGRPYAVIDAPFRSDRIGALSTQMVEHGIEAVLNWPRWKETFNFVNYESLAAGCLVITNPGAGHVVDAARELDRAIVFDSVKELVSETGLAERIRSHHLEVPRQVLAFEMTGLSSAIIAVTSPKVGGPG